MKLTPLEKEANKAANKIRNRAFNMRRRLYWNSKKLAEMEAKETPEYKEFLRLTDERDSTAKIRNDEVDAIQAEIVKLQERLKAVRDRYATEESEKVDAAWRKYRAIEEAADLKVKEEFEDMVNCYSVSVWEYPPEVEFQMAEAYEKVLKSK